MSSSGDITWTNGDSADKTITIPIVADAAVEGGEQFYVILSSPSGGAIVGTPTNTVTIAEPGAKDPSFTRNFFSDSVRKVLVLPDSKIIADPMRSKDPERVGMRAGKKAAKLGRRQSGDFKRLHLSST